jgi:TonB family protein
MRTTALRQQLPDEVFSTGEIAAAARVSPARVAEFLEASGIDGRRQYIPRRDAIRLVRLLGHAPETGEARPPITLLPNTPRQQGVPLALSSAFHISFLILLLLASSSLFSSPDTEQDVKQLPPARLIYLITPGPGGGGGGGGMKLPELPARAERKSPVKVPKAVRHPIAKAERPQPQPKPQEIEPPKPLDPPKVEPPKVDPPKPEPPRVEPPKPAPPQTAQAPIASSPSDDRTSPGVLSEPPGRPSAGPGTGGGAGTGRGTGIGEGSGAGIGPGSGGGTGGGPYQPGSGIDPPSLLREVKPLYTDEARRRSLEGSVQLEIVVRRDGSVGNLRVVKSLGAGLDERALEAVRQWRFSPAHRMGSPVDVIVQVSVEFKLR